MMHTKMFIDGRQTDAQSGKQFKVTRPLDGSPISTVPDANDQDADLAIAAAARALPIWRSKTIAERVGLLRAGAENMRNQAPELGKILAEELGRPLAAAVSEITRSAELLDVYAAEGCALFAQAEPQPQGVRITREPVGVVVAITPFNYPITLLCFKLGAALIAGCTVVAKPSEDTPLSTLALARIFHEAGLPDGCFNVVTGLGPALGKALVAHPTPRKIAFTGGTAAGKQIAQSAADTMKRLTLELGGHCPAILCNGADLKRATAAIARHGFANSGQFCYRVNRLYIEKPIYEQALAALSAHANAIVVGDNMNPETQMGPLVNARIFNNCEVQCADARKKGARILTGGARLTGAPYDKGYFFPPTLIADTHHEMKIMREETFGPIIGIMPVDSVEEAIHLSNDSPFGLAAFVFGATPQQGQDIANQLEAGSVWIDDIHRSFQNVPFGGMKQSGIGREKGRYGIEEYLEYKTTYIAQPEAS